MPLRISASAYLQPATIRVQMQIPDSSGELINYDLLASAGCIYKLDWVLRSLLRIIGCADEFPKLSNTNRS